MSYNYDEIEAMENEIEANGSAEDSVLLELVNSYDWAAALARIASHPEEASSVGMQARSPLHEACDLDAPAVVVQALLEAYPEASTTVGTSNMNPLHITCSSQHASVHVIRVLLEGGLEIQTSMRDVDGDTPLHAACRCGAPIEVLEVLLRANPSVVNERDYEGLNPVLRLWVRYFVILGNDVIDAVKGPGDVTGELGEAWRKTELLLRAAYHGSLEASTAIRGEEGSRTASGALNSIFRAVHAASAVDCPRQVVKIATIVHPGQLEEEDEHGRLPLTIAAAAPVFKVRDLSGEGYSLEDRIHGDDTAYDETNDADQDGAANSLAPSVIEILVNASPDAVRFRDRDGRLPLHIAIAHGKGRSSGVQSIMDTYPDALMLQDPVTRLYPFMLAATAEKGEFTTIFELLKSNPALSQGALESASP